MAKLIACPACKKQLSEQAPACPHCGHVPSPEERERSLKANQSNSRALFGCGTLLLLFAMFACIDSMSGSNKHSSAPPPAPTPIPETVKASIRYDKINMYLTMESPPVLNNARITINPGWSGTYEVKGEKLVSGQLYTIPLTNFLGSKGVRFDPFSIAIEGIGVSGDKPGGERIYGGFGTGEGTL